MRVCDSLWLRWCNDCAKSTVIPSLHRCVINKHESCLLCYVCSFYSFPISWSRFDTSPLLNSAILQIPLAFISRSLQYSSVWMASMQQYSNATNVYIIVPSLVCLCLVCLCSVSLYLFLLENISSRIAHIWILNFTPLHSTRRASSSTHFFPSVYLSFTIREYSPYFRIEN